MTLLEELGQVSGCLEGARQGLLRARDLAPERYAALGMLDNEIAAVEAQLHHLIDRAREEQR